MSKSTVIGASIASLLVAASLGVQSPARAADDGSITIGFAIAQSLWMSAYDGPPFAGAKMAIDDINAKGGVLGKKLKWVVADTKSDQAEGAKAAQAAIAEGAQFLIVSSDYDMGSAAATVADSHKMIAMATCAGDAKMGVQGIGPYAFTMGTSAVAEGATLAEWGWSKRGARTAYLLLDTSIQWTKSECAGFKNHWLELGGKLIGEDTFKQDDASIASQITRLQQDQADKGKADLIVLCGYDRGAFSAIRQLRSAGIDTPLVGGDALDGDYWTKAVPHLNDFYVGSYGSVFGDDARPSYNNFMKRFAAYNDSVPAYTSFAITGYSAVEALALAMQRANSTDSDKVLAEMNKFKNEDLAVGPTTFTPDLHIQLTRPTAVMGIKDGKGYFVELAQLKEPPPLALVFNKK
jgi:branched-chain amino acid transport system substrate-binding protein